MGAAGVVAVLAGRPAARWHALLLATAVTLALNPRAIEDVGWQLSFAAVVAILVLAGRVRDGLRGAALPRGLAEATALTGAATLGTAPLIAAHFGQASLVSLPANVLAAPAVAPAMWLGDARRGAGAGRRRRWRRRSSRWPATRVAYVMWVAHVAGGLPGAQASAPRGGSSARRVPRPAALAVARAPRAAPPRSCCGAVARAGARRACCRAPQAAGLAAAGRAAASPSSTSARATRR